jgi:hypothetical protein
VGYAKRLCSRAFTETRNFWNLHRNWTVIAGPLGGAAYRLIFDGWPKAQADFLGLAVAAAIGFVIAWVGTFILNLIRGTALLDRDRQSNEDAFKNTIAKLTQDLERERFNLTDAPQLILGFNQEFFIRNVGKFDARDAKLYPFQTGDLLSYSKQVAYIGPGDTLITLRCRPQTPPRRITNSKALSDRRSSLPNLYRSTHQFMPNPRRDPRRGRRMFKIVTAAPTSNR